MRIPEPTRYFHDFLDYYARAALLEDMNHRGSPRISVGDPLQDNVTIYDTVHRKYAGFSNVLRDLHREYPGPTKWGLVEWLYIYGVHRMTGSGASFYPATEGDRRHGYLNTPIFEMAEGNTINQMSNILFQRFEQKRPTFTCLGNQTPPFPKPSEGYTAGWQYLTCDWVELVHEVAAGLVTSQELGENPSVASMTDWVLSRQIAMGSKQFKFTLTAFCMDVADWHPEFINPLSQCHYGANCLTAFNAMFSNDNRTKGKKFYHTCMEYLVAYCSQILGEDAAPMDVEDCACDAVRYWSRFIPRHGYELLSPAQRESSSTITLAQFQEFLATK